MLLAAILSAGPGAIIAIIFIPYGAFVGIKWTGATALVLGTGLSVGGEKWPLLRRRALWAATGVAAALAHYCLPWPDIADQTARDPVVRTQLWWLPPIFILSGIVAALAYRSTIRLGGLFIADEDDGEA
ncbi:MAG TPA: hypothetical protein VEW04_00820 [Allosphingosinicella sp.]|nr:hypothetical protein [Allosphingosinicella sp.]